MKVLVLTKAGDFDHKRMTQDQFITSLKEHSLSYRDLMLIMKASDGRSSRSQPKLLPRPLSKCFVFDMEHIKLICFKEECFILNADDKASKTFVAGLKEQCQFFRKGFLQNEDASPMTFEDVDNLDFEHIVLEYALKNVVQKFRRHLQMTKPVLEMQLQVTERNPETSGFRRLLAVKQTLTEFDKRVKNVEKVVSSILLKDEDKKGFYLTMPENNVYGHEKLELLLSLNVADLEEIKTDIEFLIDMIENTDKFISAHLDSVRNELLKMRLFLEIGALSIGVGTFVCGIFGMRLTNQLEDYPIAFNIVCLIIVVFMLAVFLGITKIYYQLKNDTSSGKSFNLLKNFFTYVDDLEYEVFNKRIHTHQFKEKVESITGLDITEEELELLIKISEANKEVFPDTSDLLEVKVK